MIYDIKNQTEELMEYITMTEDLLNSGKSMNGGWNYDQTAILGAGNPPRKGWKKAIIGLDYNEQIIELFLELRHLTPKQRLKYKHEIKKYAALSKGRLQVWKKGDPTQIKLLQGKKAKASKSKKMKVESVQLFLEMTADEARLYDSFRILCLKNREPASKVIMSWINKFMEKHKLH